MGLFGFGRKKPQTPAGFSFQVKDIFSIKGQGLVVTGQVTAGEVACGATVTCVTVNEDRFPCVIQKIEQPKPGEYRREFVHPDKASADGPFQGSYAFWIADRQPEDFHPGDRLISEDK